MCIRTHLSGSPRTELQAVSHVFRASPITGQAWLPILGIAALGVAVDKLVRSGDVIVRAGRSAGVGLLVSISSLWPATCSHGRLACHSNALDCRPA